MKNEVKLLRETVARLEQDAAGAAQTQGAKMASLGAEVKAARGRAEELEAEMERKQRDFDAKSASLQRQVEGAVQQAVQQVGATIWSWRVARAGADYKIVDRAAEGGLQLG